MNKLTFLDLEGVNFLKDSILSIITDNEEVTASALIDLKTRLDEATSIINTLPVKYGRGDHSIVTRNTEGTQNEANGWGSISIFGYGNKAYGSNSFAGGDSNNASGAGSVVIGGKDNVSWNEATNSAIIGGHNNTVQSANSFISGGNNTISNQYDVIFGYNNYVSGIYSGAFGYGNNVYNTASFALGSMNTINSQWGFAEGGNNIVNGEFSHAEGYNNNVNYSINSHAEGDSNYIDQSSTSHAEGANNYLYGVCSHVEGEYNSINGNYAHAEGYKTQVYNNYEHAQGKYNISNSGTIHSIGIGSDDYDRKNAFEVTSDGKVYVYGIGGYNGTSLTDKGDLASTVMVRVIKITYSELYNLVQNNGLIPGAKYRITDYETIVGNSAYWKSAGHAFDIIVTALSENKLDENCSCTLRDDDTYFADSHIESWNIKYTIYNNISDFNWANTGTGKGVIYWMEDQNRNFAPFDFKNIKINPNGGSGTSAIDTYNTAKNMAPDLIQNDISSEFLRSADGFYYMFSSFDGETDLSLKNHYVQQSGVGILGKSDAVQYLSGCVILAPTEVELHTVTIEYGYWSAIIFTGLNVKTNTYGKINISDIKLGYISKSLLMIGNGAVVNIDYLSSSYLYFGYAKCIDINMLVRGFICATSDATYFTLSKQINDLIINVRYLSDVSLWSGQYIKYIGSNSFSDLTTGNTISRVIMEQTFARGTSSAYEDLKSIFDGVNLKEKMAYTTRVYYKSGGILAGTYEFNAYNKYELPTASSSVLGGIKIGSNLSIDANGVLSTHDPYTHPATHAASMITGLATVATSGSYNDLTNKPFIPEAYTHPATHAASMITGLATVATSGSYKDLTEKPNIPAAYTHPATHAASMITGLATVATSGSYKDLTEKPNIPAAYSHPDTHPASMITGLATVATSGSYSDLTNKPFIPDAYSHPDTHPASMITGLATVATSGSYKDLTEKPNIPAAYSHPDTHPASMITGLATVATSGSYNDLTNKPTIPAAYSHPDTHPASMITGLATVATSGSYNDLTNKPTIPAAYSHPDTHPASMITGLATVATTGSYNDLSNLPTIPDLKGVENQIETLSGQVDALYGSLSSTTNALVGRIDVNAGNISTNTGNIATNAGRIGTLEGWQSSLNNTVGSEDQPIYWNNGAPTQCGYVLKQNVDDDAKLTDQYPTTFTWTAGTTEGPIGSLTSTETEMKAVSFGAIPAASGDAYYDYENEGWTITDISSGIVTTGKQTFAGQKFFNDGIWLGTGEYGGEVNTDAVKIHFGDTASVWIGEKNDDALTLNTNGNSLTISNSNMNAVLNGGKFYIDDKRVLTQDDLVKYDYIDKSWSSSITISNPKANYCTVCTFTGTGTYSYPNLYIQFNNSTYKDGDEFHFIISRTPSQTITYYLYLSLSTNISGSRVKIAGLTTTYAYINKGFSSIEISVIYINKVFYAIINQYK